MFESSRNVRTLITASVVVMLASAACRDDSSLTGTRDRAEDPVNEAVARMPALVPATRASVELGDIGTPSGVTVQPLARSSFPDPIDMMLKIKLDGRQTNVIHVADPSDVLVAKLTLAEGGSVGWHTHPGPAIVTVQSGILGIINASDCVLRHYESGRAFIDPGQGNVHVGFNAASAETVVYVTFLSVPAGSGPTIPADDPGC